MAILRYLGLAEESTFNPATAPAASYHVDIASATLDTPSGKDIIFSGGLGRTARTHRPGFNAPSGNIVYPVDVATLMDIMKWTLGGQGEGFIYGSNNNLLPSFTARLGKDSFEHVFSGCMVNNFQMAVEGELAMGTVDILAAQDAIETIKTEDDLSLIPEYPLAFHEITINKDAADFSPKVKSMTFGISNNGSAEAGRSIGSRSPRRIVAGERVVTIQADLWFENTDELEDYRNSDESLCIINMDGGDFGEIAITLPRCIYTQVQLQPSGRDEMVQTITLQALVGTFEGLKTDIAVKKTGGV